MNSYPIALLKEWLDQFYFENHEGRYVECKMCGADNSRPCNAGCLCKRTKAFLDYMVEDKQATGS